MLLRDVVRLRPLRLRRVRVRKLERFLATARQHPAAVGDGFADAE